MSSLMPPSRAVLAGLITLGVAAAWIVSAQLPALGAGGLLYPARRAVTTPPPDGCVSASLSGAGVKLAGWRCRASTTRRGTLVYLHGIADNRASASGVIDRFRPLGFDVVAYDSRAHGESGGDACTYGFFESQDLRRVLDTIPPGPIVLLGTSLGGAVALQTAASDRRVSAVVAAETFADLRSVVMERAPFFFTPGIVARAFRVAEERAGFRVDATSPLAAAAAIAAPVLLVHGENDVDTPPDHSRRVYAALQGPKRLIIVPGAAHNQSLRGDVWNEMGEWLDAILGEGGIS